MSYFFLDFGAGAFLVLGPLAAGLTVDASRSLHFLDWECSWEPHLNSVPCMELNGPASGAGAGAGFFMCGFGSLLSMKAVISLGMQV